MKQTVDALKGLYVALGGQAADVAGVDLIPDAIGAIAGYIGIKDTTVQAEKGSTTFDFTEYKVSQFQTGVSVADGAITGTLKWIEGGLSPAGPLAGDGNFLALKFIDNNDGADKIEIGLVPSASGMGLVALDSDMNAVFKISNTSQIVKVVTTKNGISKTQVFDLTGLTLEDH